MYSLTARRYCIYPRLVNINKSYDGLPGLIRNELDGVDQRNGDAFLFFSILSWALAVIFAFKWPYGESNSHSKIAYGFLSASKGHLRIVANRGVCFEKLQLEILATITLERMASLLSDIWNIHKDIHALLSLRFKRQTLKPIHITYPGNPVSMGDHIRKKRMDLKLLKKDVAKVCGATEDCITNWEKNRSVPQIQFVPQIISFLGYLPFEVDLVTLPGRLRAYRYMNGLSQKKICKILRVDGGTICSWELGENQPHKEMVKKLRPCCGDRTVNYDSCKSSLVA